MEAGIRNADPAPCVIRPPISAGAPSASAIRSDPTVNSANPIKNTFAMPRTSAALPAGITKIATPRRYALIAKASVVAPRARSSAIWVTAASIAVVFSPIRKIARQHVVSTHHGFTARSEPTATLVTRSTCSSAPILSGDSANPVRDG